MSDHMTNIMAIVGLVLIVAIAAIAGQRLTPVAGNIASGAAGALACLLTQKLVGKG